jgi:hypothetical protein
MVIAAVVSTQWLIAIAVVVNTEQSIVISMVITSRRERDLLCHQGIMGMRQ